VIAAVLGAIVALALQSVPAAVFQPVAPLHLTAQAADARDADLQHRLEEIAKVPAGDVGISAIDLATGRRVSVNGDRPFPMASTVKMAIAATYLAEVDAGRAKLSDMIAVDDRLRLRADGIVFFAPHSGVTLSAANLIELMLTRSDNTATDVLLARLGGPATVEKWLERNHLSGIRIDRSIAQLLVDRRGVAVTAGQTPAEAVRRWDPVTPGSTGESDDDGADLATVAAFDKDQRDTATPDGFTKLLARLDKGDLLRPASRDWLIAAMGRCLTGANRIKGLLSAGTIVEHKTGTFSTITDDIGLIELGGGRRIAVAVFTRGGANRSTIIARASRAIYDAFATAH
jgi:beta-lactamase class A